MLSCIQCESTRAVETTLTQLDISKSMMLPCASRMCGGGASHMWVEMSCALHVTRHHDEQSLCTACACVMCRRLRAGVARLLVFENMTCGTAIKRTRPRSFDSAPLQRDKNRHRSRMHSDHRSRRYMYYVQCDAAIPTPACRPRAKRAELAQLHPRTSMLCRWWR